MLEFFRPLCIARSRAPIRIKNCSGNDSPDVPRLRPSCRKPAAGDWFSHWRLASPSSLAPATSAQEIEPPPPLVPVPQPVPEPAPALAPPNEIDFGPFQDTVRKIVLDELKEQYDDQDNWGHQETLHKYRLKGKWLNTRWEPYTEQVNEGLWQRASIKLVEPEKNLSIQILSEPSADKQRRQAFALVIAAKIEGEVQVVRWRMGLKMLNGTVRFDAAVAATIRCDLAIRREPGLLLDDVVLDPRVTAVDLQLKDFNLRQLGILGRDIARELSDPVEPFIARQLDKREPKIVAKINAAIDKRRDKLRFSPTQLVLSKWSEVTGALAGSASGRARSEVAAHLASATAAVLPAATLARAALDRSRIAAAASACAPVRTPARRPRSPGYPWRSRTVRRPARGNRWSGNSSDPSPAIR